MLTGTGQIETTNREGRFLFRRSLPDPSVRFSGWVPTATRARPLPRRDRRPALHLGGRRRAARELVTTATGEQRKLEIGNAVNDHDVARIAEQAPITDSPI